MLSTGIYAYAFSDVIGNVVGWYIRRDLRDVFPGHRNSGPHSCSGHYLTLEKLPSSPSVYTT